MPRNKSSPADAELDFEAFDLEGTGEKVSDKEIASVLKSVLGGAPAPAPKRKPQQAAPLPSRQPQQAPQAKPQAPQGKARPTDKLSERAREYETAAVHATQSGETEMAMLWLQRGKALQAAAEALLSQYPHPTAAAADAGGPSSSAGPAPPAATPDDPIDAAEAYARTIVSQRVLDWEVGLASAQSQEEAEGAEVRIEALETRRAVLLAEESALAPEALVARLQVAIVAEKKAALAHKAAARTPDAIHALRRAKLMTEEVEALG